MKKRQNLISTPRLAATLNLALLGLLAMPTASAALWSPSDITTHVWYDASDTGTITHSSGTVSAWADKSGNGRNLTGADGPVTGSNTINGLNVMTMNGNRAHFGAASFSSPTSGNLSIFMVASIDAVNNADDNLFTFRDSGGGKNLELAPGSSSQFDGAILSNNMGGLSTTLSSGPYSGIQLLNTAFNFNTNSLDVYVNGTVHATTNTYTVQIESVIDNFYLFRGANGTASRVAPGGKIAEVIMVEGVLTTSERETIEGYLAWKWGQQGSLPTGHTYEFAAPTTIPEPTTIAIICVGGMLLGMRRRRCQ